MSSLVIISLWKTIKISNPIKIYCISQDNDYVHLGAQNYYIQFGSACNKDNVGKVVEECISTTLLEKKSKTKWIELINTAHMEVKCMQSKNSPK